VDEEPIPMYTVEDIALILKIRPKSVYRLIDRKEFPALQIGNGRLRIRRADFWAWVQRNQKYKVQEEQQEEGVGCY
jgi:excisionase family DNA binding protein